MTPYNVYGNAIISQEELSQECPAQLISGVLRNHSFMWDKQQLYRIADHESICDALAIEGTATLIHTKTSTSGRYRAGPVIRNGDYLYIVNVSGTTIANKTLEIMEYQISTQTKTYITVATSTTTTVPGRYTRMALIEDRKLIVADEYLQSGLADQRVFIVDFEEETSTLSMSVPYSVGSHYFWEPDFVLSCTNDAGDILLFVIGVYYNYGEGGWEAVAPHGMYFYYKNYTQDTAWAAHYQTALGDDYECSALLYLTPARIGTDCLVALLSVLPNVGDPIHSGMMFFKFDLNTLSVTKGSMIEAEEADTDIWTYYMAPENDDGCVYGSMDLYSADWHTRIFKFDSSTMAFSVVHTCSDWDEVFMFSDREHVYYYDADEDKMYDAATQTLLGSYSSIPGGATGYLRSTILDDGGPAVIYWTDADNTLRAIELDGTAIDSFALTVQDYALYNRVDHLGDRFLLCVDNNALPNTVYYYLVT